VTVPGCVDGWVALSQRFGRLHLAEVLEPAVHLATDGFDLGPLLFNALRELDDLARPRFDELTTQATRIGAVVKRPGIARTLASIGTDGRNSFYLGEFGTGLRSLTDSWITAEDLSVGQATWEDPLSIELWDHTLHAAGPNSQAYLTLATMLLASAIGIPDEPDDPMWAHLLIEATLAAGHDRDGVLHEFADGRALVDAARRRHRLIPMDHASRRRARFADGDTTAITTADADMAVSLIQSNAAGFGSWLVEPSTAINLHNRGIGFSLVAGHDNELHPGRRPAHTLSPITFCSNDGSNLIGSAGTMGGDAQPQILAQVLTRLLYHRQGPAEALTAPRWSLRGETAFDTWTTESSPSVMVETSSAWADGLGSLGHRVIEAVGTTGAFGHANLTRSSPQGLAAAGDPRSIIGAATGR
jgi:gamma-glutamyltranspeptidase/glutathione hydrolase